MRAVVLAVAILGAVAGSGSEAELGHTVVLNTIVDALLEEARGAILAAEADTLLLPDVEQSFYVGWKYLHISGRLAGRGGWVGRLSTLSRTGDATLTTLDRGLVLSAEIGLSDLRAGFDSYSAALSYFTAEGATRLRVGTDSIALQLLLVYDNSTCTARLDRLEIVALDDISVTITGMWKFNWLYGKLVTFLINHSKRKLENEVTDQLRRRISDAMVKYNICKDIPHVAAH